MDAVIDGLCELCFKPVRAGLFDRDGDFQGVTGPGFDPPKMCFTAPLRAVDVEVLLMGIAAGFGEYFQFFALKCAF